MKSITEIFREIFSGSSEITYRDKILKHRLHMLYRGALIIILVLVIFLAVKIQVNSRVYSEYEVVAENSREGAENSIYKSYYGNLLVYSKDGITAFDKKGVKLWNQPYEMQNPIVRIAGQYAAVGDYRGSIIYIMDMNGLKSQVNTDMIIQDFTISEKGVVTAVLDKNDSTLIRLISADGTTIIDMRTSMADNGYPLAVSLSQDNLKLGVSYLQAKNAQINTSIAFYNFGDVGQNKSENLVSGYNVEEEVIPFLQYVNSTTAVALGNQKLLFFKGKQIPELSNEVTIEEEVQSIYYNEKHVALVFHNTSSDEKYRVEVYDLNGKQECSFLTDIEYKEILITENDLIVYNESSVEMYNTKGDEKYRGSFGENISAIMPLESRGKFIVVKENTIETIRLR
ncbi:MAG: DUF5711 family protein [Roseburia sp.]|nr:DUF5711 family protein [Roseburia sp.]MCM1280166.1 DUF5711 family protein [Robinsoniella sp.]